MATGLITRDGQIVYQDRRNNKLYVLQGIAERVNQQAQRTIGNFSNNLREISDVANVTKNFVQSVGTVGASFNRNYIRQEFNTNLANIANDVNNTTQQTRNEVIADANNPQRNQPNITQVNETNFSISAQQKAITTSVSRQNPAQALSDVAIENRRVAENNGYSVPLTVESTGPTTIYINGQRWYKATATVTYKDFNPLNKATLERLIPQQSATTITIPSTLGAPITSVPLSVQPAASPTITPSTQPAVVTPPTIAPSTQPAASPTSSSTQSSSRLTQINSRISEINTRRVEIDRQVDQIDRILMTSTDQATYDRLNPTLRRLDAEEIALRGELNRLNQEKAQLSR